MWFNNRRLVLSGLAAVVLSAPLVNAGTIKVGDQFPDLGRFGLEGKLPDTKNKVVVVDFWASWCGPCRASFPVMQRLHKDYAERGLVIVAVNLDDKAAAMDEFLKKNPVTFAVVRDAAKKLVATANVAAMPTSFVLSRDGRVHAIHNGFRGDATQKLYIEQIEQLLDKP
jgi:thiol-disulfide isomerase/thioredoxin